MQEPTAIAETSLVSQSAVLRELIDSTPWIDTHEHLVEEQHRLSPDGHGFRDAMSGSRVYIPGDWTSLIVDYALDDLVSAGLAPALAQEVIASDWSPLEKWDVLAPYLHASRQSGYMKAVDLSTERLFGSRLSRQTCAAIDHQSRVLRREGYYTRVLRDVAHVERCHVNSSEVSPFCRTATPDLLQQDLSLIPLVVGRCQSVEEWSGIDVGGLDDYLDVIEWCFAEFGPLAVAVKCLWAYARPLAITWRDTPPRRAFDRMRRGESGWNEARQVQDFLFARCVDLATMWGLPVKLHVGYLAGHGQPHLSGLSEHVGDVAALAHAHPRTTFVLLHMGWPHEEELLAVAKHSPNVVVDLAWAWILTPIATSEFVQRFLTTVAPSKLLTFGGDYLTVETVVGHAELARRGLQAALEQLTVERLLSSDEALALVPQLMRGNAEQLFRSPLPR